MQLALTIALLTASWTPPGQFHTEHFTFRYTRGAEADALALARRAEQVRLRLVAELGKAPASPTVVVVTATRAEFRRAQPGRPLPGWVAGVAYVRRNLIILGPGPPGRRRANRLVLFAHEYSHVALAHAVGFRRLPTWFVEGFADLQAMAPYAADPRSWGGRGALPLGELHKDLGHSHRRASESYQQSYDLVRFLRDQGDAVAFHRFIHRLAQGVPFNRALKEVYSLTPDQLAKRWKRKWNWERVLVPMMTSGLFLWVIAAVLLIIGFVRKRRERLSQIAAMEGEEGDGDDGDEGDDTGEEADPAYRGGNGSGRPPAFKPARGVPGPHPGSAVDQDAEEVPASPALLISFGMILIGTVMALLLTALLTLIWPHTRAWVLAGPAVVVTFLGLRWMSRK